MGFAGFWGGILLSIFAVLLAVFGVVILTGYFKSIATSLDVPLGIGSLVVALALFMFGWFSYKSDKPQRNDKRAQSIRTNRIGVRSKKRLKVFRLVHR